MVPACAISSALVQLAHHSCSVHVIMMMHEFILEYGTPRALTNLDRLLYSRHPTFPGKVMKHSTVSKVLFYTTVSCLLARDLRGSRMAIHQSCLLHEPPPDSVCDHGFLKDGWLGWQSSLPVHLLSELCSRSPSQNKHTPLVLRLIIGFLVIFLFHSLCQSISLFLLLFRLLFHFPFNSLLFIPQFLSFITLFLSC